jgi:hypothetical protein
VKEPSLKKPNDLLNWHYLLLIPILGFLLGEPIEKGPKARRDPLAKKSEHCSGFEQAKRLYLRAYGYCKDDPERARMFALAAKEILGHCLIDSATSQILRRLEGLRDCGSGSP